MITSFIKKYILPKEVDFLSALNEHSMIIKDITDDLYKCFLESNTKSCKAILEDQHKAKEVRDTNMKELLNTFITPFDRESIYRVITELDWIAISVRHFVIETQAYNIHKLDEEYGVIIKHIQLQAELLTAGFKTLKKNSKKTAKNTKRIRDTYDELMDLYVKKMAKLAKSESIQTMFIQKEILTQLKEISKRMRMTANSLEDIVMKMS
ncbi:DUF47 domain-containing protein [Sulfurimonas autotrophica]|uniref:DUF47 family protein n=1 Tax=Sulfurimonas autotrophica (strain ATCC BAA-671 / DSM 16294 / JCM 11897 / OK10) TaxID=563040 RepID=E0URQ2_SULAO|nr:DUF47 family protein [Sulfurimonas autotrophica]ADN08996.1 hypothetical protein Saut_0947 [Sulfurimonas autotrophica DSM 16294]